MTAHFVCLGNTFRSRLAEAYFNSKRLVYVKAISSGIHACDNDKGSISWLTQRLIEIHKLILFHKSNWTQTSKRLLDSADLTIFFDRKYYEFCIEQFGFHSDRFEIWNIGDLDANSEDEAEKIRKSENTFKIIRQQVDDLIEWNKF